MKGWIGDRCEQRPPTTTTPQRARGIVTIHRPCMPPCPRKVGAVLYLPLRVAELRCLR